MTYKTHMAARILIIEDDDFIRQALVFKLQKNQYATSEARDGEEGFMILKDNGPFDLVLLDIRMPKADGIAFLEKKSADEAVKNVPVIVFTNLADREYSQKALALGIKGYIIKAHHSLEDMLIQIEKCLHGEQVILEI
jgi:CheY-like chemotaxis protein